MKKSVEIDPTDVTCQGYLAWIYLYFGHFEEAIAESRKLLQLDGNNALAYYLMGSAYSDMGMHFEAIEMQKKGLTISPGNESGLAIAYIRAGQKEKALEVVAQMEKFNDQWWYCWGLAQVYATLGNKDKAINYLEDVYRLHGDFMPWFKADPNFKSLRNEPRFKELGQKLNLPA